MTQRENSFRGTAAIVWMLAAWLGLTVTPVEASRSAQVLIPAPGSGASGPAGPSPSHLSVADTLGIIERVTVTLHDFEHGAPDDVDVVLVGPNGARVVIMSDAGGHAPVAATLVFDDNAAESIPDNSFPAQDSYRPTNVGIVDAWPGLPAGANHPTFASAFNGISPNGLWSLYVVDDHAGGGQDVGRIAGGWSIAFTVRHDRFGPGLSFPSASSVTATPYPGTMTVQNVHAWLERFEIVLDRLTTPRPDDLDVLFQTPWGQNVLLMSGAGANTHPIVDRTLTFSESASQLLPGSGNIPSGTYRPSDHDGPEAFPAPAPAGPYTMSFNFPRGTQPNGTWRLFAYQDALGQDISEGPISLDSWRLIFHLQYLPPTIQTPLPDLTMWAGSERVLTLGVVDGQGAALTLTGTSTNPTLLPQSGIAFSGSGSTRTMTLTPAPGETGSAIVSVRLFDGTQYHDRRFTLTVLPQPPGNTAPEVMITDPTSQPATTASEPLVTLRGWANDNAGVTSVTWSNTTLGVSGSATGGANWTASNIPLAAGANVVTVTATDAAGLTGVDTLTITVNDLRYYLAEGATGAFFDFDIALANPNPASAPVTIEYLREDGTTVNQSLTLSPNSRATVRVDEVPGLESTSASAVVRSTAGVPLVVERTMRWDASGYGGHTGQAVAGPRTRWLFAEGSQGFFDTFLLLANGSASPVTATVSFLREAGGPVTRIYDLAPTSRMTIHAGTVPELANQSFGLIVDASAPIFAERAMYFPGPRLFEGGHESPGVNEPSTSWFLAEGATGSFFDTFVLVANPNSTPAHVHLRYLLSNGDTVDRDVTIDAEARYTVSIETVDPRLADAAVSTVVTADVPVLAERAMYWPALPWREAHNSFGVTTTAARWGLAEGRVGGPSGFATYILLANPTASAADVAVTFLREQGDPIVRTYRIEPTSRFNIDAGAMVPELDGQAFGAIVSVTNGVPIAVERAMYWNANGEVWAAGTGASAVRLP